MVGENSNGDKFSYLINNIYRVKKIKNLFMLIIILFLTVIFLTFMYNYLGIDLR